MRCWVGTWRLALRLAWADARHHTARTILAVLLIGVALTGIIGLDSALNAAPDGVREALRRLPAGVDAKVVAAALPEGPPLAQPIEGFTTPLFVDSEQAPVTEGQLREVIGSGELHPYWDSTDLLATRGKIDAFADEVSLEGAAIASTPLHEVDGAIASTMIPAPAEGRLPGPGETVVSRQVADALGLAPGNSVTLVAPPDTGWFGVEGRIAHVLEHDQRSYTVSGIAEGKGGVWTLPGWLSEAVDDNPDGINREWLLTGHKLTWDEVQALNRMQVWASSRAVLSDPPPAAERYPAQVAPEMVANALVAVVLGAFGGLALLLATVTPAFWVAARQHRRTLGLLAANGAKPRDLRRVICAQGVVVGACGSAFGVIGGLAASLVANAIRFDGPAWEALRWPLIGIAAVSGVVIGYLSALVPAWQVSRFDVVASLGDLPDPPSRLRVAWWLGPAALAAAVVVGVVSVRIAAATRRSPDDIVTVGVSVPIMLAMLVTLTLGALGVLACIPLLFAAGRRCSRNRGLGARLAFADAADHASRAVPACAAIAACAALVAYSPTLSHTTSAIRADETTFFVADGGITAGMKVPVSDAFDAEAMTLATAGLAITRHAFYAVDYNDLVPLPQHTCPDGEFPTLEATLDPGTEFACTWRQTSRSISAPSWLEMQRLVASPDAIRATRLEGAAEAAEVLEAGGVVVNAAYLIDDDGMASVDAGGQTHRVRAALLPAFAGDVTVSPEVAREWGLPSPRLTVEIWDTGEGRWSNRTLAEKLRDDPLVAAQQREDQLILTQAALVAAFVALGVAIIAISLALARTQTAREAQTMAELGATPRFLSRLALARAGVLLGVGIPLGAAVGLGFAAYTVALNRATDPFSAWHHFLVPWAPLGCGLASLTLGAAAASQLVRPSRRRVPRRA